MTEPGERLRSLVTERSRETVAAMLLFSLLLGGGVAAVDGAASLEQFETESEAAEKQAYIDENFGSDEQTTGSQIIVEGDDVLTRDGLLATLVLQERLRANETVNSTLAADPFDDLAGIVAETSVRLDRAEQLEADAEDLEERADELNESRDELETWGEDLEERADELNESRDELETRGEDLEERADELNESRDELETRGEDLEERAEKLEADAEELEADAEELEADAEELEEQAESFEIPPSEIEERQEELEQREEELEQRRAELEEREEQLREDRAELEADAEELEERADELNESRDELEARAEELEARAEKLEAEREELEARAEELEARAEELEARAEELEAEREELADLELTLTEQQDELRSMNDSEITDVLATILDGENGASGAYVFLPTDYEDGTNSTDARTLFVTHETTDPDDIDGEVSDRIIEAQLAMAAIVEETFESDHDRTETSDSRANTGIVSASNGSEGTATPTETEGEGDEQRTQTDDSDDGSGAAETADSSPVSAIDDGTVFGEGLVFDEIDRSMADSFIIVLPLALLFVAVVLTVAYRDVLDILLGLFGILMVLLWTFGFMGWTGIEFNQVMISVPVLLVGLSIDYAIHVFMRHREQRGEGDDSSRAAMRVALGGVGIALLWVTATAAIGFLSNLTSPIEPLRAFGIVNAFGILAALVIFTVFVPALKVELDSMLEARGFDRQKRAFGTGGGPFSSFLDGGRRLAVASPWGVVLVALLLTSGGLYGAAQLDTSFEQEDFIADEPPEWMDTLPEPFAPGEYSTKSDMAFVNDRFVRQDMNGRILLEGDVASEDALQRVEETRSVAAEQDTVLVLPDGSPDVESPLSVMEDIAAENATFNESFVAADTTGDGVPDENLGELYDELFDAAPDRTSGVIYRTDDGDYEAMQVVVTARGDAPSEQVTDEMRVIAATVDGDGVEATATGQLVVFDVVEDELFSTVIQSLLVTLVVVFAFLMVGYRRAHESASLGFVTLLPVVLSVSWILGTMHLLDIPFNVMTGTITSLTIGLGIAYNIHMSERYVLERKRGHDTWEAISRGVTGTGGALLGSAATTAGGFGVLAFSILPSLQQFGIITGLTIVYAFLGSVFLLPSLLVIWTRAVEPGTTRQPVSYLEDDDSPSIPSGVRPSGPTDRATSQSETSLSREWRVVYERLGLSSTEATALVVLQTLGGASTEDIIEATELDRSAVEAALDGLADYGLVWSSSEEATGYRPLTQETAVQRLFTARESRQTTLEDFAWSGGPAADEKYSGVHSEMD